MSALSVPERHETDGARLETRAVFIADFVHLAMPFSELIPVVMDAGAPWLRRLDQPIMSGSRDDGTEPEQKASPDVMAFTVRIGPGSKLARQPVRVTSGPPRIHEHHVIVPITWEPLSFERLLPRLEADLVLSEAGESFTRLALSGRYHVPLAQLGMTIDRLAMHRIAESSMRGFLADVEASIIAER